MNPIFLKKFEGKNVNLVLNNNFVYNRIKFNFIEDDLIQFEDKTGSKIIIDAHFVRVLSEGEN